MFSFMKHRSATLTRMPHVSNISLGIRNTMKAGRHGRSSRPSLEAMEGRILLTALPLMYANSASVVEHGTGPVTMPFTINLSSAAAQAVTVNYQTSNSTAIAGTDYTVAAGTLTIPAGQTSGIIPVTVLLDQAATGNKVFYLSLSGASGATLESTKLAGTITEQNTPPPPSLSIASVQETVGTSGATTTMTFTVSLNEALTYPVTVTATTKDLTAKAGVDYAANSQVLTFAPGAVTEQFVVTIDGSTKVGSDYFLVNLTAGSVSIGTAQASGIIVY
jgi:Calx-beta domain